MKLDVALVRHAGGEFTAHVVQEGKRGPDVLKGLRIRNVDRAAREAVARLRRELKALEGLEELVITWVALKDYDANQS